MMTSFWNNLRFELTSRKRFIGPYIFWATLFALSLLMVLASGGGFKGVSINFGVGAKVFINSPFSIHLRYAFVVLFGLLIISPIYGQAICKDYEAKFDQIILATPTQRIGFYAGRFFGATIVSSLIFTGLVFGNYLGSVLPFVQKSLFTSNNLMAYVVPYFTIVIPNIIIFGSIAFAVGAIAKKMSAVYIAGILCFMAYLFAQGLSSDTEHKTLKAMIDPFGLDATSTLTRYWSVAEMNSKIVSLTHIFLWNRLAWLGFSLALLAAAIVYIQKNPNAKLAKSTKKTAKLVADEKLLAKALTTLGQTLDFSGAARCRLVLKQLAFEAKSSLKNIYFLCLAFAGVVYVLSISSSVGRVWGTTTYPVTYQVLEITVGTFSLFLMIIMTFYIGELMWRERQSRMDQIIDALPVPIWLVSLAKFLAMQLIVILMLLIVGLCGVVIQVFHGYTHFELGLVFKTLFTIEYVNYFLMSVMMFTIHSIVNNKFVAHGLVVLFLIARIFLPSTGLEHLLYNYSGGVRQFVYSDMNGFGPFLFKIEMLQLYWGLFAILLLLLTYLFWSRGTDHSWRNRLKEAKERFSNPLRALAVLALLGFLGQGSYIFYNTNVVNIYKTSKEQEQEKFDYEKKYKAQYQDQPLLKVTKVNASVDLFPSKLWVKAKVDYVFENKSGKPVEDIFVVLPVRKKFTSINFNRPVELTVADDELQIYIYRFKTPVLPGETVLGVYVLDFGYQGLQNEAQETALAYNGTFFNNDRFFPSFGYDERGELDRDKVREQYGLQPKPRMYPVTDEKARDQTYVTGPAADWIDFESTVSTDKDQIAIAPGYLQKEWFDGDRHYYQYKMDRKILNFYSFLSARYEVKRDKWNDENIEIYYQKGHEYNLEAMNEAAKEGLAYFSESFGPYQHKQFRILEFPRYARFAQSFPNTVPFSESIGFIAKVDPKDEDDLNYPYFVTAHELAHQWWAHQVISANVQGATFLSESLAEYSALLLMEKKYGREKMAHFLKFEMDGYLQARSSETKTELPLALNENQQYIHYNKGGLVMFALKEVVGEKALNAAIKKFAEKVRYQEPPFTTGLELVATLKENLDPKFHGVIDDMLMKITLYDNRIVEHSSKANGDGTFTIDLAIKGTKVYVDDKGNETDADMLEPFEITVQGQDKKTFFTQTYPIHSGDNHLTIKVAQEPKTLWLDALGIWIDKNRDDNKVTF